MDNRTRILSLIHLLLFCTQSMNGQGNTGYADLNVNNIEGRVQMDALHFMDPDKTHSNFIVPAGSGKSTIFGSALWIGAYANKELHLSAMTYRQSEVEFHAGPLDTGLGTIHLNRSEKWDKMWTVTKQEIEDFKKTGVVTNNISSWPAHGDASPYEAKYLAPFIDTDHDGIYNPSQGDHPAIKGDKAAWWVFNDRLNYGRETNGPSLGIEVHAMAYAFKDPMNPTTFNTLFFDYKIINRSKNRYDSMYIGIWTDFDIGYPFDDHVGSHPQGSYYFGYNGDDYDETTFGYGSNPPLQAVVFLKDSMTSFIAYNNDFSVKGNPSQPDHYYRFMRGQFANGDCIKACYTCPCTPHMFPGDPQDTTQWSESFHGNQSGDRRGVGATGPKTLKPGEAVEFPFAYVYVESTFKNGRPDISPMTKRANKVRNYYSYLSSLSTPDVERAANLTLYPNPAGDKVHLSWKELNVDLMVSIMDMPGRTVFSQRVPPGVRQVAIPVSSLSKGLYLVQLRYGNQTEVKRLEIIR